MRRSISAGLMLASTLACGTSTSEPKPLSLTMSASRTTAVTGDTIAFVVDATGGSLVGLELTYGDAGTDQYGTSGATTAHVTFRHAYTTQGTFTARVVLTDALAGQKDATVDVHISAPP